MGSISNINLQTKIGDLPLQDCQVSSNTMGQVLAHQFEQRPDLGGVVVVDHNQLLGLISRTLYYQIRDNPTFNQTFLNNSVRTFLKQHQPQSVMVMGAQETIDRAVKHVLQRHHDIWHEPIVVVFSDQNLPEFKDFLLLDVNLLIQAQYQRNRLLQRLLQHHTAEQRDWSNRLAEQQQATKQYEQSLDLHQELIEEKEQKIDFLQAQLGITQEQLNVLNHEISQLHSLVGIEIDRACKFTYEGADQISSSTDKIAEIGHLLRQELNSICGISELIGELSNQFRHLAVQAAIITNNNPSIHMHGFSKISSEISKLVVQTLDVGRKTDRIAYNFRSRIDELTSSAEEGTKIAYSLVDRMAEIEQVFHDQLGYNYVQDHQADPKPAYDGQNLSPPRASTALEEEKKLQGEGPGNNMATAQNTLT